MVPFCMGNDRLHRYMTVQVVKIDQMLTWWNVLHLKKTHSPFARDSKNAFVIKSVKGSGDEITVSLGSAVTQKQLSVAAAILGVKDSKKQIKAQVDIDGWASEQLIEGTMTIKKGSRKITIQLEEEMIPGKDYDIDIDVVEPYYTLGYFECGE